MGKAKVIPMYFFYYLSYTDWASFFFFLSKIKKIKQNTSPFVSHTKGQRNSSPRAILET